MIAAWMAYALLASALLTGAAAAGEAALRRVGRPGRWVWAAALGASLALAAGPWLARGAPGADARADVGPPPAGAVFLPALEIRATPGLDRLDGPLLTLWAAGSLAVLAALAGGWRSLARRRRRWAPAEIDGRRVLVSPDFGPAVVGLVRPAVVLPGWVAAMEPAALGLVLVHEEEHVRARDVPLLAGAAFAVALIPWNAPLWLQLRRLRTAVELDCDRRVLRGGAPPLSYADLLLRVGGRRGPLLAPALAEPARTLERRLTMIVDRTNPKRRWAALAFAGLAALALGLACEVPSPTESAVEAPGVLARVAPEGLPVDALYLVDGTERSRRFVESLPRERIARVEVLKGSAARSWGERGANGVIHVFTRAASFEDLAQDPTFTPFTVAPDILNRAEVIAAMDGEYPPLLRDAGVGGSVRVHFLLDADGAVRATRVDQSSGHAALDAAALRVASTYRFSPALNGADAVPVWISLPITFQVRGP